MFCLRLCVFPPLALESGGFTAGLLGVTSSPMAMGRRIFNYDEALDAPMHSPPSDFTDSMLWKNPIIPERKFKHLEEVIVPKDTAF